MKLDEIKDGKGNVFIGDISKVNLKILGENNRIECSDFKGNINILIKGNQNCICVGKDCFFQNSEVTMEGNASQLIIGERCVFLQRVVFHNGAFSTITVGDDVNFNGDDIVWAFSQSDIKIGCDALLSWNVLLQTGDGHPIFDLDTQKQINYLKDKRAGIVCKDHIWFGRGVKEQTNKSYKYL